MSIKWDDQCPSCNKWIGDLTEDVKFDKYRSKEGFSCPLCNETLRMKFSHKMLLPATFLLWAFTKLLFLLCDGHGVVCTSINSYLNSISSVMLITFIILLCSQNLKQVRST